MNTIITAFLLLAASGIDPDAVYMTATVTEKPLDSATASVTIVDRETISSLDASSLADILRLLPAVSITGAGTRGSFTTAEIRGGDPNFTLVLLNGVPLNDATYQVGDAFDLSGISADAVTRIEIVRGPQSAFYGSTGLAGVINIITVPEADADNRVLLAVGDADLLRAGAHLGAESGSARWFIGASTEREKERVALERFEQVAVDAGLDIALTPALDLEVTGRFTDWESDDYPDASGGPVFGDGALRLSEHRETVLNMNLDFTRENKQRHQITAGYYRHVMDRQSPAVFPMVPAATEHTGWTRLRLAWRSVLYRGEQLEATAGLDMDRQEGENRSTLDLGFPVPGNYRDERTTTGAYAELRYAAEHWVLELSARVDDPDEGDTQFNPRFGFSTNLSPGARLHGNVGRAFKLPSFFAAASPPELGGNPNLEAETTVGADLGVTFSLPAGRFDITVFHNTFENLVDFDFGQFLHVNRAEVEATGVESSLTLRLADNLDAQFSLTWQDVEDPTTGEGLRHRPEWRGGGMLTWSPDTAWRFTLDLAAVSSSLDQQLPVFDRFEVSGHTLLGLNVSRKLGEAWQGRLRVDNLADEDYENLIGYPGPGQAWRLGLRYARGR
ncbi:MAG: TonB-dependent receptor [Acidobacteriota bacterium]|nr:TonB-dependent receptor [Acidobacteriota bacterium]